MKISIILFLTAIFINTSEKKPSIRSIFPSLTKSKSHSILGLMKQDLDYCNSITKTSITSNKDGTKSIWYHDIDKNKYRINADGIKEFSIEQ